MTREMRDKRAGLLKEARSLVETAGGEQRALSAEEQQRYDALMAEVTRLTGTIQRMDLLAEQEQALGDNAGHRPEPETHGGAHGGDTALEKAQAEQRAAISRFIDGDGPSRIMLRALQADVGASGGFMTTPVQFVSDMIKAVDNLVFVRQWARGFQVATAQSLGAPALAADPADPVWTSELGTGDEDSTMAFGLRELYPHPLAKRIKVSRKLLRMAPGAEALVRERLSYKFGVTLENAYLNGTGVNQPLGVFVASAMGINTDRDYATGNAATYPTFDGLIGAKYTLKQQYHARARWLFHRDAMSLIAKLKDGEGQYLWRESVRAGEPDRILGIPVYMSEYVPNTFTANMYVGILGDWAAGYWYADALEMDMQRLDELYAESNQVGFIGRLESDGMPVLSEAFVRVKLGAG